jgi:hypothetical protein
MIRDPVALLRERLRRQAVKRRRIRAGLDFAGAVFVIWVGWVAWCMLK